MTATWQLIDRTCPAAQRLHRTGRDCENAFAHHIVAGLPGKKAIGIVSLDGSAVGALLVWGVAIKAVTALPGCSFRWVFLGKLRLIEVIAFQGNTKAGLSGCIECAGDEVNMVRTPRRERRIELDGLVTLVNGFKKEVP